MTRVGLFAFGVTSCVLVPAAIHRLSAGPQQVAKLLAPGADSLAIDDTKIKVALDRAIVDPGDKVHVKLTATAPKTHKVTVAVVVLESIGSGGGRVESPPNRIARESITLEAKADGGATREVSFALPGFRGQEMDGIMQFGHYTILVMPPKAADQLERLRRRAASLGDPMGTDNWAPYEAFENAFRTVRGPDAADSDEFKKVRGVDADSTDDEADTDVGAPNLAARLDVTTRPNNSPVRIIAPDSVRPGQEFAVKVRVTNRTKKAVSGVSVHLGMPQGLIGTDYKGLAEDDVKIEGPDGDTTLALAPRETKALEFKVTVTKPGVLGLYARSECNSESCEYDRRLVDGALEAIDVVETSTVVGKQ